MAASDSALMLAGASALLAFGGGVLVAVLVVWRRTRRRWQAFRRSPRGRNLAAFAGALTAGSGGAAGPAAWRHQMWQSVAALDRSLTLASADGDRPPGEISSLARQLHGAATEIDRMLAMAAGLPPREPVVAELSRQVGEVAHAARTLRLALLAAAGAGPAARAGQLARDAARELDAVAAGVARTRVALPLAG